MATPEAPSWMDTITRAAITAIPTIGGSIEVIYSDVRKRRAAKAAELFEDVIRQAGELDFLERLSTDERLEEVFVKAVDSAMRTSLESKRRLLVLAVADASRHPENIDRAELIVEALANLDVQQVRALARLSDEWEEKLAAGGKSAGDSDAWKALTEPIQAALVRTGTAKPTANTLVMSDKPKRSEGITDFGLEVVSLLRAEGLQSDGFGVA